MSLLSSSSSSPSFLLTKPTSDPSIVSNTPTSQVMDLPAVQQRRLAQYHPTIWGPNLIDSFSTRYTHESYASRSEGLKKLVCEALLVSSTEDDACSTLILIDSMQRLGVGYHFEKEIEAALVTLVSSNTTSSTMDLQTAALHFRIIRQYGIPISSELDMKSKASYSRDRLLENYMWSMGISYEPQYSQCRIGLTKFVCILTVIDDMYDVYGFLDELEQFTDVVTRWNVEAKEELSEYMKPIYSAMIEFGNELVESIFETTGLNTMSYIKNEWINLCKAYMLEARWFYSGHTPTLEEYLNNAWTSVGGPGAMLHAYLLTQPSRLTQASLDSFNDASQLVYWASMIVRLTDDLGTSTAEKARGDITKSLQCYMEEKGMSEEEAHDYVKSLIWECWKRMNKESAGGKGVPRSLVDLSRNMARTAHCIFEHGDGIGNSIEVTKDRLVSLIANLIPLDV